MQLFSLSKNHNGAFISTVQSTHNDRWKQNNTSDVNPSLNTHSKYTCHLIITKNHSVFIQPILVNWDKIWFLYRSIKMSIKNSLWCSFISLTMNSLYHLNCWNKYFFYFVSKSTFNASVHYWDVFLSTKPLIFKLCHNFVNIFINHNVTIILMLNINMKDW